MSGFNLGLCIYYHVVTLYSGGKKSYEVRSIKKALFSLLSLRIHIFDLVILEVCQ